ncbi:MAG: hypothetical protein ACQER9_03725 [Nanobdellota archaeon]
MTKNIFEENYFDKHRDSNNWKKLKPDSINKALNLKRKYKENKINSEKEELQEKEEEKIEKEVEEGVPQDSGFEDNKGIWKKDYFKTVLAGLCGGFVVLIVQQIRFLEYDLSSMQFWTNAFLLVLTGLIFILVFGLLFKIAEDRV